MIDVYLVRPNIIFICYLLIETTFTFLNKIKIIFGRTKLFILRRY